MAAQGRFISIEGVEGSGKSTQIAMLDERLRRAGRETVVTREPGGTPVGEAIRELLLARQDLDMSPLCELLLFNAARAEHVRRVVGPAVAAGKIVISDRFSASTFAYQAIALGVGEEAFDRADAIATGGLRPDLTIILDVPAEVGLRRKGGDEEPDRIEQRSLEFHARVREGYRRFAEREPERTVIVDGTRAADVVHAEIVEAVEGRLSF